MPSPRFRLITSYGSDQPNWSDPYERAERLRQCLLEDYYILSSSANLKLT